MERDRMQMKSEVKGMKHMENELQKEENGKTTKVDEKMYVHYIIIIFLIILVSMERGEQSARVGKECVRDLCITL